MNRIFWRIWNVWSEYVRRSSDSSWFTSKIAVTFVLFLYLMNWLVILAVGKQRLLTMLATAPGPRWFRDSYGRPQPYIMLVTFLVCAALLAWLFGSSSGRKLKVPLRSALLAMAVAGLLGLVTELLLRL
jgi:hypothetical protein